MKTTIAFIFVPVETAPELFKKRMHECLAALDEPHPDALAKQVPEPFWTWFVDNPRPQKSVT